MITRDGLEGQIGTGLWGQEGIMKYNSEIIACRMNMPGSGFSEEIPENPASSDPESEKDEIPF